MQGQSYQVRVIGLTAAILLSACTAIPPQGVAPPVSQSVQAPAKIPSDIALQGDTYTVQPGDTLIRIGLDSGQSPRDIARWSGLSDPSKIVAGQVLRLVPPPPGDTTAVVKPHTPTVPTLPLPVAKDDDLTWNWPAGGRVLAGFSELKTKGLEIGGVAGDAVVAAADGKVIYAGADLRGYGNSIIVKHNKTYVTLYAHNRTLLVKEDDVIKRGQKIAEMGSSETDRVKLHFEVRKLGTSVDPAAYLPAK